MVGDDWERDIEPAVKVGISAFWIAPTDAPTPGDESLLVGRGTLADLLGWLAGN
jgi:FMN phosphatase YigB (HAD superfamily)